jgi:hypothetical protein
MLNLAKLEYKKIKPAYWAGLITSLVLSAALVFHLQFGYRYYHNIDIWENTGDLLWFTFPILSVLPTCWLLYFERKDGFLFYTTTRISKKKYLLVKWLITSFGSGSIVFLGSFFALIISLYFLKTIVPPDTANYALKKFAGYYYVCHPLLYGFVLSLWRGFLGFLAGTLGFVLSLYVNNAFIVLTGPFAYSMMENYILATLHMPEYRLAASFDPSCMTPLPGRYYFVGALLLMVFILFTIIYFMRIKKVDIYAI